jgi:hypothetical protein
VDFLFKGHSKGRALLLSGAGAKGIQYHPSLPHSQRSGLGVNLEVTREAGPETGSPEFRAVQEGRQRVMSAQVKSVGSGVSLTGSRLVS